MASEHNATYASLEELIADLESIFAAVLFLLRNHYTHLSEAQVEYVEDYVLRRLTRFPTRVPKARGQVAFLDRLIRNALWEYNRSPRHQLLVQTSQLPEEDRFTDVPCSNSQRSQAVLESSYDIEIIRDFLAQVDERKLLVFEVCFVQGKRPKALTEVLGTKVRNCQYHHLQTKKLLKKKFPEFLSK